jgi:hypothetical protein
MPVLATTKTLLVPAIVILAFPPLVPMLASLVPLNILLALSPVTVLAFPNRYAPVMLPVTDTVVPV